MKSIEITEQNFSEVVLNNSKPVLVDFWAKWCGPCLAIGPVIDSLAEEFDGKVVVGKVNTDTSSSIASKYAISSIPTILLFKNGVVVDQMRGGANKASLKKILEKYA